MQPGAKSPRPARAARRPSTRAAELAARRQSSPRPARPRGVRQDGSHRAQLGQRGAFQNGGGIGSAAPFGTAAELAARRLSERRREWQRGAFQNGGGMGCAWPSCAGPARPGGAPGRQPSRPAWEAQRLSKRRRNGLRSAFQNGGGMGCAAPFKTAAEWAALIHGAAPSSARGRARTAIIAAPSLGSAAPFRNGGGIGSAAPSSPRPARPGVRVEQLQLGPGGARVGHLQLGPWRAPGRQPSSPHSARPRLRARRTAPARAGGACQGTRSSPLSAE